jgi:hypothetical protein
MEQAGVFGERLEITALSELLRCRVSLYYYCGGTATPNVKSTVCLPAETFDGSRRQPWWNSGAVVPVGPPIAMLHHVSGNHFQPVVLDPAGSKSTRDVRDVRYEGVPAAAVQSVAATEQQPAAAPGAPLPSRRNAGTSRGWCGCGGKQQ